MNFKKILVYFVIPMTVSLTLIGMYFSGNNTLQEIVSPRMPGYNPDTWREFGLLENLQNLVLLAMFIVVLLSLRKKTNWTERLGFVLLAVFTLFVFLEEIDYGLHYYEYINDIGWKESREVRNWHNQGDRTDIMKQLVDAFTISLFLLVPLLFSRSKRPLLRYIAPDRHSILTLVAAFLTSRLAHSLQDMDIGTRGTIHNNLSEFRELVTYYVYFLFVAEVGLRRSLPPGWSIPWRAESAKEPVTSEADSRQAPDGPDGTE